MTLPRFAWLASAALLAAVAAFAQPVPPAPPPVSATPPPLPPASATPPAAVTPPPPTDYTSDNELEPQVTIIRREAETVEEVRVGGQIQYVRVTPRHGKPYFLIPDPNGHAFIRRDSLDIQLKVPMWVLFSW